MSNLTLAGLSDRIGHELGLSDWVTIDQPRIDAFAACTGDRRWIHVDVERAKRESPFHSPIAHGYLTLAMVAPLAMEIGVIPKDAAAGLEYGIDKVRFLAPVPSGARVRLRVVLCRGRAEGKWPGGHEDPEHAGSRRVGKTRADRRDPRASDSCRQEQTGHEL